MSVDAKKLHSACKALKAHIAKSDHADRKHQLFEDSVSDAPAVYLCVQGRRYFGAKRGLKPHGVELAHTPWGAKKPSVCLFSKDPQRAYKNALQVETEDKIVDRIVGVSKLKGKFKQYEARRSLKQDHDLFLAEKEVLDMLPHLLGKSFYGQQRSVPIGVKISKDGEPSAEQAAKSIAKVLKTTYFVKPSSTLLNVRIGTTSQAAKELAANALRVIAYIEEKFGEDISGFRSLGLKTTGSPMLPFFYAEKLYDEEDVGSENEERIESSSKKRKREMAALDKLLAEVVDEEDIKEYNLEQRALRRARVSHDDVEKPQDEDEDEDKDKA